MPGWATTRWCWRVTRPPTPRRCASSTCSPTPTARALRNGLLDGAALTPDEALRLADGGLPVVIIAMINQSEGADAVLARPDVLQASDLRGRVIGLEKTALGAVVSSSLQEGSLRPNEVSTLHVEVAQHADMMGRRRGHHLRADGQPARAGRHAPHLRQPADAGEIIDVLVVRRGIAPQRLLPLLQAWERGRQALEHDPAAAAALLAVGTDLSETDYICRR